MLEADPYKRARQLRESFRGSFATRREQSRPATEDLLLIRCAGRQYGIRLAEIRALHSECKITPLPLAHAALLGIVGIRGQLVAAYSLAAILEAPSEPASLRWLAVCERNNVRLALGFEEFVGSVRVAASQIHAASDRAQFPPHVGQLGRVRQETCYILSTESIIDALVGTEANGEGAQTSIQPGDD